MSEFPSHVTTLEQTNKVLQLFSFVYVVELLLTS